jgi:hypothetical protein
MNEQGNIQRGGRVAWMTVQMGRQDAEDRQVDILVDELFVVGQQMELQPVC